MPDLRLVVEICHASNLLAKDADGTSSPFVVVEFDGQRQKTRTKNKDLNPAWNETLEFKVRSKDILDEASMEIGVFTMAKDGAQQRSLGSIRISCSEAKRMGTEAANTVVPYSLERRNLFKSAFSRGRGELYLKLYYYEAQDAKEEGEVEKAETKPSEEAAAKGMFAPAVAAEQVVGSFDVKTTMQPKLKAQKVVHELVESIEYLFVKVVKARWLAAKDVTGSSDPYVEVNAGSSGGKAVTEVRTQTLNPEWNRVFAFARKELGGDTVEVRVWDKNMVKKDDFLGCVGIDVSEIPSRRLPDSPLAPRWYKLEPFHSCHDNDKVDSESKQRVKGEIMLAVWYGTQSDEAFPDAWQSDTGGNSLHKSKVYISPRLWYLRVLLLQAQDLFLHNSSEDIANYEIFASAVLDCPQLQTQIRRLSRSSSSHSMNFVGGDILFVAPEPFVDKLTINVFAKVSKDKDELIGSVILPLYNIPKRFEHKPVEPTWYDLQKSEKIAEEAEKDGAVAKPSSSTTMRGRIHATVSLEGGYHVLDETTHRTSDVQPADRRLRKPAVGVLELGILSATSLLPTKATKDGRGTADAYCIAKYGNKWIRTRTVVDSLSPQWHEQYTWEVYDPCTVLTVGVFDNHLVRNSGDGDDTSSGKKNNSKNSAKDVPIGKLRIRLSTLHSDQTYTHSYPLISMETSGVKKKGDLEIAIRFSCTSQFHLLKAYSQPLLPTLHYVEPLSTQQTQALRKTATRIQTHYLSRAEPPIRGEVVSYILDAGTGNFSYRRTKAAWNRMVQATAGVRRLGRWVEDICWWRNRLSTSLVLLLYTTLVWFPEQILPTLFLYMFMVGAWHWRYEAGHPPHMDVRLSQAGQATEEELDEEFDTFPSSSRSAEVIKARYERLRGLAARLQSLLLDAVAQLERINALLSWRDPRATAIFLCFSFFAALLLYLVPLRLIALVFGFYLFRPPRFRHRLPSVPLNFFKRLPSLADSLI